MLGELSRRDELHPFFIIESKNYAIGNADTAEI
jgi:hypothetical protein